MESTTPVASAMLSVLSWSMHRGVQAAVAGLPSRWLLNLQAHRSRGRARPFDPSVWLPGEADWWLALASEVGVRVKAGWLCFADSTVLPEPRVGRLQQAVSTHPLRPQTSFQIKPLSDFRPCREFAAGRCLPTAYPGIDGVAGRWQVPPDNRVTADRRMANAVFCRWEIGEPIALGSGVSASRVHHRYPYAQTVIRTSDRSRLRRLRV